jgi:peptidoglycan/LPS O-acetylase OafA/YrhL
MISRRDGDLLRSTASTIVVITHCVNIWVRDFAARQDLLSAGVIAAFLDQLSRFTVPAFFMLSGYALTQQQIAKPLSPLAFYRKRLPRILEPFFLWSLLTSFRHFGYFGRLPWRDDPLAAIGKFAELLFLKGFDYQYYFLIVIFQFYLLFPLLFRAARSGWLLVATLVPLLLLMSPIEAILNPMGVQLPRLYSYLLVFYLFYCVAGMHAAWNPDWMAGLLARLSRKGALVLWLAALALVCLEFWINIGVLGKKLWHADHFNRWVVILYCAASFVLLLRNRDLLKARVHDAPRWQWLYAWVTPFSFFVYLAHTHVLRLADLFLKGLDPWLMPARIVFVLAGSYALAWAAQRLLRNAPKIRYALGLPK